jgi:hypothetical protein
MGCNVWGRWPVVAVTTYRLHVVIDSDDVGTFSAAKPMMATSLQVKQIKMKQRQFLRAWRDVTRELD